MRLVVSTLLVCLSSALSADAADFAFSGRFTSNRGRIYNFPAIGNADCGGLTVMTGDSITLSSPPATAGFQFRTRGVNTQPTMITAGGKVTGGVDLGCVKHVAGKLVKATGTMAQVGGRFTLPTLAWYEPFPSNPSSGAVAIKYVTAIPQLATSFRITGPKPASMLVGRRFPGQPSSPDFGEIEGGTMANPSNLAPWLVFDKLSMIPISMRSGRVPGPAGSPGKFTWCPGAPNCVNIAGALAGNRAIVKYNGGGHSFGGTMSYLMASGPNASSLAIAAAGASGPVNFQVLDRSGSQPTGRGYAQLASDQLKPAPNFLQHMQSANGLITTVMGALPPDPGPKEYNYGFPFTTMAVLVRNTGSFLGNPRVSTITAMGSDMLTGNGGRNISLVAGGVSISTLLGQNSLKPEIASMLLPEPGGVAPLLAGTLGLLALARWRARRAR